MQYEMLYWDGYKWSQEMFFNNLDDLIKELNRHQNPIGKIENYIEDLDLGRELYLDGHLFRKVPCNL